MKTIPFLSLPLSEEVQNAIVEMGFTEATPIQTAAIPLLLEGRDVIGQAQTGTGKTAAFAIPALERLQPQAKYPQALIVCPTRELAIQVAKEFEKLSKFMPAIQTAIIYGGDSITRQMSVLKRGAQIVVGTPGRLIDHLQRGTLDLSRLQTVILDEADEMLNMGFKEDIERILSEMPESRQTVFFSATMPKPIMDLTRKYQRNPELVKVVSQELTGQSIEQSFFSIKIAQKIPLLIRLITHYNFKSMLVFCNTKLRADEVCEALREHQYLAESLHGDLSQAQRNAVMQKFRKGQIAVLVATDVAARGLDIPEVEAVFNFDTPLDPEYYVHRIGRTGRAGKSGMAFTFAIGRDLQKLRDIERYAKTQIKKGHIPTQKEMVASRQNDFLQKMREALALTQPDAYLEMAGQLLNEGYEAQDLIAVLIQQYAQVPVYKGETENLESYEEKRPARREQESRPGERRERRSFTDSNGEMKRLFMNAGKKQKINKGDIVGAITGELGIKGSQIGQIDLYEQHAYVELRPKDAEKVMREMKNRKIKGLKINFEVAEPR